MPKKNSVKLLVFLLLLTFPLFAYSKKNRQFGLIAGKSRAAAPRQNEQLVIGALKRFYDAESTYFSTNEYNVFGNLKELRAAALIDESLAQGEKYGYLFRVESATDFQSDFKVVATPKTYGKTGLKSYYFDSSCVVRGADKSGADADQDDAVIEACTPTLAYANDAQWLSIMRNIMTAEETYRATVGNGGYGYMGQLYEAGLIKGQLAIYYYKGFDIGVSVNFSFYWLRATPARYGHTGFNSYYADQTGVLRRADHHGGWAEANDPPAINSLQNRQLL